MARPTSGPQRAAIADANAKHWLRAYVRRFDLTWIPLHNIPGLGDMLLGASITERLDANMMSATIRTGLMHNGATVSPLSGASVVNDDGSGGYAPLLNGGSLVRIDAAITTGAAPVDGDFVRVFEGKIDEPNFTATPVTLTCRDMGSVLADTIIRDKRTYGATGGIPAHQVMQSILTDNAERLGSSITLAVPVAPTYVSTNYQPFEVSVMDALNTLAAKFGWVVRYRFDATGAFVLTLYDPQRDKVVEDDTIAPTEYRTVERAALVTTALRTVVGVNFLTPSGEPAYVEEVDTGARAVFGELYLGLGGETTKDLDQASAIILAQSAIKDLARPLFEHVIKTPLAWFVQLGDLLRLTGNAVHYEDPQLLAVRGIQHDWPDGGDAAVSTFEMSGHPAGAYEAWLKRQGGVIGPLLPPAPILTFLVAEGTQYGGTSATVDGGIWLGFTLPPGIDETRFYVLLGDGPNLGVPPREGPTLAPVLRRPEGDIGATLEYSSMVLFSTDLQYWKRILMESVRGVLTSLPVITDPIQAVDPVPTPADGAIASITVVRDGTVNTVTVTPASVEPTLGTNYLCIMRNKQVLPLIPIGTSLAAVVFQDTGLDPSKAATYAYEAFIANIGPTWCVTGSTLIKIAAPPPGLVLPQFVNDTPIAAVVANVQKVQIDYECATPGVLSVQLEASIDGVTIRVVGTGPAASGTIYDPVVGSKLYRLVAIGAIILTNPRLAVTPWKWYTAGTPPLSVPGSTPTFENGTPKLVFGTTFPTLTLVVGIEWKCATPLALTLRILRSTVAVGGPFSIVANSASVAAGTWKSPQSYAGEEAWYQLQAIAGDGTTVLASSGVVHFLPVA